MYIRCMIAVLVVCWRDVVSLRIIGGLREGKTDEGDVLELEL